MTRHIFDTSYEQFQEDVILASKHHPIMVDLWAEWCPPCLVITPILKEVIDEYQGEIKLAKIEVDDGENMKIAGQFQVRGFPTILLIQNGQEVARFSGAKSKNYVMDFIEQNIS